MKVAGTDQRKGLGVLMCRRAGNARERVPPSLAGVGVAQNLKEVPALGQHVRRFHGAEAQIRPEGW